MGFFGYIVVVAARVVCGPLPAATLNRNRRGHHAPPSPLHITPMKYYTSTTQFNCGIDLHARQMYVCVVDRHGTRLLHQNIQDNDFAFFLSR